MNTTTITRGQLVVILAPAHGSGRDFTGAVGRVESIDTANDQGESAEPIYVVRVNNVCDSLIDYYRAADLRAYEEGGAHV